MYTGSKERKCVDMTLAQYAKRKYGFSFDEKTDTPGSFKAANDLELLINSYCKLFFLLHIIKPNLFRLPYAVNHINLKKPEDNKNNYYY
jgi:hypothetical protein